MYVGSDFIISVFFQPIGSHLFVYPWSHGYSSKREEFCESDFKKSIVAGPEKKKRKSPSQDILTTVGKLHFVDFDSMVLRLGELF